MLYRLYSEQGTAPDPPGTQEVVRENLVSRLVLTKVTALENERVR